MRKIMIKLSAAFTVAVALIESRLSAYAATTGNAKNMSSAFEKIFDFIFKDSLDSFFEKLNAENKVRAKTGVLVVLFVIIASFALITIFRLEKKEDPALDDEDEDEEDSNDTDDDDELM